MGKATYYSVRVLQSGLVMVESSVLRAVAQFPSPVSIVLSSPTSKYGIRIRSDRFTLAYGVIFLEVEGLVHSDR